MIVSRLVDRAREVEKRARKLTLMELIKTDQTSANPFSPCHLCSI
jgi:hypothetical protein